MRLLADQKQEVIIFVSKDQQTSNDMEVFLKASVLIFLLPFVDCKITLDSFNFSSDESLINGFTPVIYKDHAGMTHVNASGNMAVGFFSGVMESSILGWRGERSPGIEKVIFKGNVDICDMTKGVFGGFIRVFVSSYVEKYSNLKILCPMPKGHYYLRHCPFDIEKYLPPFWVENGSWELAVKAKVKLTEAKAPQLLFDFKSYGTVS